ncbi:MAG: glycosyl hydrolase [Ktedonobacteraceae bacterium]|nr:glycosyl hydrolase [Ktedonobacteraceae bacterium]
MTTLYIAMEDALLVAKEQQGRWQLQMQLDGLPTYCVAHDPHMSDRLYCGTFGKGLWVSDDGGGNWRPAGQGGEGIGHAEVMSVAVSPVEREGKYGLVWVGTEPSALYRSEDGGESWQELRALQDMPSKPNWSFPPRPYTHHVRWIEPDPVQPGRLYVAIEQGGIMRTLDGGQTWEDHKAGAQIDGHTLATHKRTPGRVYEAAGGDGLILGKDEKGRQFPVLTRGGYAESHDGGVTWETQTRGLEQHHYLWSIAVDPADPDTIVASAAIGPNQAHFPAFAESFLYRRTRGTPWQMVSEGLPEPEGTGACMLASVEDMPGVFYAATGRGVYRSQDAGLSWQQLDLAIPDRFRWQRAFGFIVRP